MLYTYTDIPKNYFQKGLTSKNSLNNGYNRLELSNHLGNVMVTVSDKRLGQDTDNDDKADFYFADVTSATDYYPFGKEMPGRQFSPNSYRFSFNGKEDDTEWGNGLQDYGFRIYSKDLGKFLSVDPLSKDFAYLTPYQFASNTPIMAIDLDGLEAIVVSVFPILGGDPALKQVRVEKIISQIDQPNLTVRYDYYDDAGQLINSTQGTNFIAGSVEAQLANSITTNGNRGLDELVTKDGSGIQDPQSTPRQTQNGTIVTKALNGFQYDLNIEYKPGGFEINESDLAPTNSLEEVNNDINSARNTLNSSVPFQGLGGNSVNVNLANMNLTVVGQTDGASSNHQAQTTPNNQTSGNPALAQDRANVVADRITQGTNRTVNTSINVNSGSSNQSNRSTKILITP